MRRAPTRKARAAAPRAGRAALTAASMKARLHARADPALVPITQRFFRTAPGQYGEGDIFIGVRTPAMRLVCRECRGATLAEVRRLLQSPIHEERMLALMILVDAFPRAEEDVQREIFELYLSNTRFVNNWDLVDASAPAIVGGWLNARSKAPLTRLARSAWLWERRIAIVATHHFIRRRDLAETFRIADLLLNDPHDLIHKAVGWMLREAGKRDPAGQRAFLVARHQRMPRTMLRYAIERFPERERRRFLEGRV